MGIDIHRDSDPTVLQYFLDHLGIELETEEEGGRAVPEVMKPDRLKSASTNP